MTFKRLAAATLAARAWLELARVDRQLRRRGFQACLQQQASATTPSHDTGQGGHTTQQYARAIERAARWYPGSAECLHQSLVLHRWMRRDGLPSRLRVGVLRGRGTLRAHAWVELDGRVVNDRAEAVGVFTRLAGI